MDALPQSVLLRLRTFQDFTSDRNCLAVCSQWKDIFSTPTFPGTVTMADINRFPSNLTLISLLAATIRHVHIEQAPNQFHTHDILGSLKLKSLTVTQVSHQSEIHIVKMLVRSEDSLRKLSFVTERKNFLSNTALHYPTILTGLRFPKLISLTISIERINEAQTLRDFVPRLKLIAPNVNDLEIKALPRQDWLGFLQPAPWGAFAEKDIFLEEYKVENANNDGEVKRAYVKKVKDIAQEIQDAFNANSL